jgi:hypothetical protein
LEKLVDEKIIKAETLKETPAEVVNLPVIRQFTSSKTEIERGEEFTLSWQIENANKLELHKNGAMYRPIESIKTSINLVGFADGTQQQSSYQIVAYKDLAMAKSDAIFVKLKQRDEKKPIIKKRIALIIGGFIFILALLLLFVLTKKQKIDAYVKPQSLWQGIDTTISILGKNLPATVDLTVLLNDDTAKIIDGSADSLRVLIPQKKITPDNSDMVYVFLLFKKNRNNIGNFTLYPPVTIKQRMIYQNANIIFYGRNLNSDLIKVFLDNNEIPVSSRSQDSLVAMSGIIQNYGRRYSVNLLIKYSNKEIFNRNIRVRNRLWDHRFEVDPGAVSPFINR